MKSHMDTNETMQVASPTEAAGQRACPSCGAMLVGEAKVCPLCGHIFKSHRIPVILGTLGLAILSVVVQVSISSVLRPMLRAHLASINSPRPIPPDLEVLRDRTVLLANHVPSAVEKLGTPITEAGEASLVGGQMRVPVKGPKGTGTLQVKIWGIGEGYTLSALELHLNAGESLDLWPAHVHAATADLRGNGRIYLVPIGTQRVDLNHLVEHYQEKFGLKLTVLGPVALPPSAYDLRRGQWVAEELVAAIRKTYASLDGNDDAHFIGITDDDIYIQAKDWRFAYSLRQQPRSAVISTARMDEDFWRRSDPVWRAGEWLQRSFQHEKWVRRRASQTIQVEHAAEQMITKDIAVLYWRIPLNDDPQSVMLSLLTPDGKSDDLWLSDLAPEDGLLGLDTGCPQLRLHFDRAGNVSLDRDGVVDCESLEPAPHGQGSVIVHLASGMVEVDHTDFRLPGTIPLEFRRLYGSYWAKRPTILGPGWSHSYATNLGSDCPGSDACVSIAALDGSYQFIQVAPSNDPRTPPRWEGRRSDSRYYESTLTLDGPRLKLTQANGDIYWFFNCTDINYPCSWNGFRRRDGTTLDFESNSHHHLTGLRSGSSGFDLTYDEKWRVTRAFLSSGEQYEYDHDADGCLNRVLAPDGSAVLYRYAGNGCYLTAIAVQPSPGAPASTVLTMAWQGERVRSLALADGRRFAIAYEGDGVYASAFDLITLSGRKYHFEAQADKNYIGWLSAQVASEN